MMKKSLITGFISLMMIFVMGSGVLASEPSETVPAVSIMRQLKETPVQDQAPIYRDILRDTSVLRHGGVREELRRIANDQWYNHFILGNEQHWTEPLDGKHRALAHSLNLFKRVVSNLDSPHVVRVGLKVMPSGSIVSANQQLVQKMFKTKDVFLKNYLKEAGYQGKPSKNAKNNKPPAQENWRFRVVSSNYPMPKLIYKVSKEVREEEPKNHLQKKLNRFAWNVLKEERVMPELKTFAIAYLLDEGVAIEKIKRKLVHPDRPMAGGATLSGGAVKDAIIEEAQEWRSDI